MTALTHGYYLSSVKSEKQQKPRFSYGEREFLATTEKEVVDRVKLPKELIEQEKAISHNDFVDESRNLVI